MQKLKNKISSPTFLFKAILPVFYRMESAINEIKIVWSKLIYFCRKNTNFNFNMHVYLL